MSELDILFIGWLFSQSTLSHLGVWIYGIICFGTGILFGFFLNFIYNKIKKKKEVDRRGGFK